MYQTRGILDSAEPGQTTHRLPGRRRGLPNQIEVGSANRAQNGLKLKRNTTFQVDPGTIGSSLSLGGPLSTAEEPVDLGINTPLLGGRRHRRSSASVCRGRRRSPGKRGKPVGAMALPNSAILP